MGLSLGNEGVNFHFLNTLQTLKQTKLFRNLDTKIYKYDHQKNK